MSILTETQKTILAEVAAYSLESRAYYKSIAINEIGMSQGEFAMAWTGLVSDGRLVKIDSNRYECAAKVEDEGGHHETEVTVSEVVGLFERTDDLPEELKGELSVVRPYRQTVTSCCIEMLTIAGHPLLIDEVIIGTYRKHDRLIIELPRN